MGQLIYLKRTSRLRNTQQSLSKQTETKPQKKYLQASMVKQEKKKDNPLNN